MHPNLGRCITAPPPARSMVAAPWVLHHSSAAGEIRGLQHFARYIAAPPPPYPWSQHLGCCVAAPPPARSMVEAPRSVALQLRASKFHRSQHIRCCVAALMPASFAGRSIHALHCSSVAGERLTRVVVQLRRRRDPPCAAPVVLHCSSSQKDDHTTPASSSAVSRSTTHRRCHRGSQRPHLAAPSMPPAARVNPLQRTVSGCLVCSPAPRPLWVVVAMVRDAQCASRFDVAMVAME